MKFDSSIAISGPAEKIWNLMTDPVYFSRWQEGYASTVQLEGRPGETGYKAQHVFTENNKKTIIREEVLESRPKEQLVVRKEHPAMTTEIAYRLQPGNGATALRADCSLVMKAFSFKVLSPFLRKPFQRQMQSELERLKAFIESENS